MCVSEESTSGVEGLSMSRMEMAVGKDWKREGGWVSQRRRKSSCTGGISAKRHEMIKTAGSS